jgi:hypothetical protein
MRTLRASLAFAVFCAAFYFAAEFCNAQTDGFSIARIHSDLSYHPEWDTAPISMEKQEALKIALNQKFHYLACGGQCFAFASEDGQYVIKFFKHHIRKPYSFYLNMPLPDFLGQGRRRRLKSILHKLNRDFTSYKIAYEELQEETGVIYIHLNKGTKLNYSVQIVDKIGIQHQISLDDVEFVLQRKADLVYSRISDIMAGGDLAAAREAFHSILEVILSRCQKGIYDEDPRIHRNFGFLGKKSIFIDVGRFVRDPQRKLPEVYKNDLQHITQRFRSYLEDSYPMLVPILDEELYAVQNQN